MTSDLQAIQTQVSDAMNRIQRLEAEVNSMEDAHRWKHLIARPHRWRRQLSLRQRRITVGQLVSTIRANRLNPEQAAADLDLPI